MPRDQCFGETAGVTVLVRLGGEALEIRGEAQPAARRTSEQRRGDFGPAAGAREGYSGGFYAGALAAET